MQMFLITVKTPSLSLSTRNISSKTFNHQLFTNVQLFTRRRGFILSHEIHVAPNSI